MLNSKQQSVNMNLSPRRDQDLDRIGVDVPRGHADVERIKREFLPISQILRSMWPPLLWYKNMLVVFVCSTGANSMENKRSVGHTFHGNVFALDAMPGT